MHSAVTSFESVAGLANVAPFVCFAIKSVFRHFQCLKKCYSGSHPCYQQIIWGANPGKGGTSGSCSDDKSRYEQRLQSQLRDTSFLQHPVWRSQRGFPDKAVSVLRTWLFEHFLHLEGTIPDHCNIIWGAKGLYEDVYCICFLSHYTNLLPLWFKVS